MPGGQDGGQIALSGFLYQLIGGTGVVASALGPPAEQETLYDVLLTARHETFNQDLVVQTLGLNGTHKRTLIQFKFSSQPDRYPLTVGDLAAITETLQQSRAVANRELPEPTSLLLATNRSLNDDAQELLRFVRAGDYRAALRCEDPARQRLSAKDQERYQALSELQIIRKGRDEWTQKIKSRAADLGVLEGEFDDAVYRLIGRVFIDVATPQNRQFDQRQLDAALAHFANARELTPSKLSARLRTDLDLFGTRAQFTTRERRRKLVDLIRQKFAVPLIVLHGPGGSGKTVAMFHAIRDEIPENADPKRYVAATFAPIVQPMLLSDLVAGWRNAPQQFHGEPMKAALGRLQQARRPGDPPILLLGLDGLDESAENRDESGAILRKFFEFVWAEFAEDRRNGSLPRLVVLVTCRSADDWTRVARQSGKTFSEDDGSLSIIHVGDFDAEELAQLAHEHLPEPVANHIIRSLRQSAALPRDKSETLDPLNAPQTMAESDLSASAAEPEAVESLKHPLVWRFFSADTFAQHRTEFLNGSIQARHQLMDKVLEWFLRKAVARRASLDRRSAIEMLKLVAEATADASKRSKLHDGWVGPASAGGLFGPVDAMTLYQEALSFGLIVVESKGSTVLCLDPHC